MRHWAQDYLDKMVRYGLYFQANCPPPDTPVTRAQLAKVVCGLIEDVPVVRLLRDVARYSVQVLTNRSMGSGTVVGRNLILTNMHVVHDKTRADPEIGVIFHPFAQAPANGSCRLVRFSTVYDLALLETDVTLPFGKIPFSTEEPIQGQTVYVLGAPLGKREDFCEGEIRSTERYETWWMGSSPRVYGTTIPVNPGNSGGTAMNINGEFVGVPVCKEVDVAVDVFTFLVPAVTVEKFLKEM
jgi:S1-C subfamily serine protease